MQRIVQLRRLFLERLEGLQAARGAIIAFLSSAFPSQVQHRQSTVAQLEVYNFPAFASDSRSIVRLP